MKPYGQKHASKICSCVMCGKQKKDAVKKRARRNGKKEETDAIKKVKISKNGK